MKKDKNWSISYRRVLVPTSIKHQWINAKGKPADQQTGKVEKWFWVETPEQLLSIKNAGGESITKIDWSDVENHDTTAKEIVEYSMAEEIWCHDDANQLGKQLGLKVAY